MLEDSGIVYEKPVGPDEQLYTQEPCNFCGMDKFCRLILGRYICQKCEKEKRQCEN